MAIQANPKHTIFPLIGVAITALLLWVWDTNEGKAENTYYINQGFVFGTEYHIQYEAAEDLEPAIKEALQEFDNSLSMFNPHSILSAVNANRDTVTNATFEAMFDEATKVYYLSGGAFDITVAPLVKAFGFGPKSEQLEEVNQQTIDSLREFVGFYKVQLEDHHVKKDDERVQLDAGAVAKGQSCDMIAAVLRDKGCENYLIEIGGEVVAHGVNAYGKKWSIGISKPKLNNKGAQKSFQEILQLTDACVATSGNYYNFRTDEESKTVYGHTIDPRYGHPVQQEVYSATVISSTCMRADALATACMVLGADEAIEMIEKTEDSACMLIVKKNEQLEVVTSLKWAEMTTK